MKKLLYSFLQNFTEDENLCEKNEGEKTQTDRDSGIFYRAEENETLETIALKFNCPPSAIIKDNALFCEIRRGNLLYIERGKYPLYRVKPSDDLNRLCRLSQKTLKELLDLNKTDYFYPWQLIKIR